jgi:uncharacterized protein involved in exopolysaccharide biosynthesis
MNQKGTFHPFRRPASQAAIAASGFTIICIAFYFATAPIFITPLYQSESLVFVPLTILSKQIEQQGIGFASDREIDAYIQILESGHLRDSLINRFNLAKIYGIDPQMPGGQSRLHKIIASAISIQKTRFGSVSIRVKDPDPNQASKMANAIVELGNNIKEDLLSANRKDALAYAQTLYDSKVIDVRILEKKIDSVGMLRDDITGSRHNLLSKLQVVYSNEVQELAGRKNHLEREQRSFETELPKAYVISNAIPDDQAVSPKRLMISLSAGFIFLFLFSVILILRRDVRLEFKKD